MISIGYGYYCCSVRGKARQVFCRDPFLAYALLLYENYLELHKKQL